MDDAPVGRLQCARASQGLGGGNEQRHRPAMAVRLHHRANGVRWLLFDNENDPYQLKDSLYDPDYRTAREKGERLDEGFPERTRSERQKR